MTNLAIVPIGQDVPDRLKRPAQMWIDGTRRCYKCDFFKSNMPLTGRCGLGGAAINSHDTMRGDICAKFELKKELTDA